MRPWIALAAKLYPQRWRVRYGAEFDALMQDVEPDCREFANVLGGAIKMQLTSETAYFKLAAAMAAVGAVVALGISLRVPERYQSTAVLRVTPPPPDERAMYDIDTLRFPVLSRNHLAELIQRPYLDLYRPERRMIPLEEVIERMRHDVQITRSGDTMNIAFTYPDRQKARMVVQELARQFVDWNRVYENNLKVVWKAVWQEEAPPGPQLDMLTPASDARAQGTNRLLWAIAGAVAGALLAAFWRWPRLSWRLAACTVAGCVFGGAASYTIAPRYTSSVIMHISPPYDVKRWYGNHPAEKFEDHVHRIEAEIFSTTNLEEMILRPSLNLYQQERSRESLAEVARAMHDRDLRIELMSPRFRISYTYEDPLKAQAVVREFVTQSTRAHWAAQEKRAEAEGGDILLQWKNRVGDSLSVLEPATLPVAPVSPNRVVMAAIGAGVGLFLGGAFVILRRPRDPSVAGAVPAPAV
jgi:hypothetical protein